MDDLIDKIVIDKITPLLKLDTGPFTKDDYDKYSSEYKGLLSAKTILAGYPKSDISSLTDLNGAVNAVKAGRVTIRQILTMVEHNMTISEIPDRFHIFDICTKLYGHADKDMILSTYMDFESIPLENLKFVREAFESTITTQSIPSMPSMPSMPNPISVRGGRKKYSTTNKQRV